MPCGLWLWSLGNVTPVGAGRGSFGPEAPAWGSWGRGIATPRAGKSLRGRYVGRRGRRAALRVLEGDAACLDEGAGVAACLAIAVGLVGRAAAAVAMVWTVGSFAWCPCVGTVRGRLSMSLPRGPPGWGRLAWVPRTLVGRRGMGRDGALPVGAQCLGVPLEGGALWCRGWRWARGSVLLRAGWSIVGSGAWPFVRGLPGTSMVGVAWVWPEYPAVTLGGFGPAAHPAWACVCSPYPAVWFRGFPAAAVTLGGVAGCAQGGSGALGGRVVRLRKGLLWAS